MDALYCALLLLLGALTGTVVTLCTALEAGTPSLPAGAQPALGGDAASGGR